MDDKQFAKLVSQMREAQKEYFRTRNPTALEASKQLEKRVDVALSELLSQPSLF